jgi:hypothetical protein
LVARHFPRFSGGRIFVTVRFMPRSECSGSHMVCSSGDFESWDDVLPMPHQMTALHVSMGSARRFRSASHGHWSDATNATLMSMKVGREGLPPTFIMQPALRKPECARPWEMPVTRPYCDVRAWLPCHRGSVELSLGAFGNWGHWGSPYKRGS